MAYLSAVSSLDNVIQYEIDDPTQTIGGAGGGANAQAQALLNRTKYIYDNFFNRLTQTLDNVPEGTSYKRIQAAIADALNGGSYKGNLMPYTGMMKSGTVTSTNSTTPQSTGINVNAYEYAKDVLLMLSGHNATGDATYTALYHLRFGYDGNYWQATLLSAQSPGGGTDNKFALSVVSGVLHINTTSAINFRWTALGNYTL